MTVNNSYHIYASYNTRYYLGNQLFVRRSQYTRIENPFISNLEKPECASKRDLLQVATLQYLIIKIIPEKFQVSILKAG